MISETLVGQAAPDLVALAQNLAPRIVATREEAERTRQTPPGLARALAEAGLYQMFLPRSAGGPEVAPLIAFEAIEALSRADGSVGWNAMIGTDISLFTGWLAKDTVRSMAGSPPDLRVAGSLRPQGKAWPVKGGYRVKGRWNFASGITHANWLYCTCLVMDGEQPAETAAGTPRVRAMWLPIVEATVVDTWATIGMRGTGSQDFSVDDVVVPADRSSFLADQPIESGPLYQPRMVLTYLWALNTANALGIARGAMDAFVEMAGRDASTGSPALLRDRPAVQARVGEAEAIINACRAYVVTAVDRVWHAMRDGETNPAAKVVDARIAVTHGMHEAVRAVDILFKAAGTNAIYTRNPLERHFRDIHVAIQHNSAFMVHYESAGKALMGIRPTDPGW